MRGKLRSPIQQRGGGDGGGVHAPQRLGQGKVYAACSGRQGRRNQALQLCSPPSNALEGLRRTR
jgi:hypothetical protein